MAAAIAALAAAGGVALLINVMERQQVGLVLRAIGSYHRRLRGHSRLRLRGLRRMPSQDESEACEPGWRAVTEGRGFCVPRLFGAADAPSGKNGNEGQR